MSDLTLHPIGLVRSPYQERKAVPRLGGKAAVELFPEYVDGLLRLERHSHLWVFVWLDRAQRDVLQVIPRGIVERNPANLHGVFAVRSPVRPNPIGLTLARVVRIEGPRIEMDRLDFMDGTPVVDLKPYFLSRDAVYAARNEQIGRPASRDALRESLLMQALNFAGDAAPDVELAVDLYTHFRADLLDFIEPRDLSITVPSTRAEMIDAFIGMTRCTPGRGSLRMAPEAVVRLEHDGGRAEYDIGAGEFRWRAPG